MQGIEKTEAIYHQSPLWIEMEKYGVEEWTKHNQTIIIPSLTIDEPHLICPENSEMSSNSLKAR